jgi:lipopolysaccharide transport system ATP-binding protein
LLEVGTGFHPELSGRENVLLNATILGMGRKELARKFDQIVEFSGVEQFLDTPVKRYSSGMYVRLAFAVAAHVEADILLVDEVLAVGDAEFQKRCLGVMGDVARGGRTVLFVSHNLTALRNLCTKGLLLSGGSVEALGPMDDVLKRYSFKATEGAAAALEISDEHPDKVAVIRRVAVTAADNAPEGVQLSVDAPFNIAVRIEVRRPNTEIGVFISCFDGSQNRVFSSGSFFTPQLNGARLGAGMHEFFCSVPASLLNTGDYTLDVSLIRDRSENVMTESSVVSFHVEEGRGVIEGWHWPILGVVRPRLDWARVPAASSAEHAPLSATNEMRRP